MVTVTILSSYFNSNIYRAREPVEDKIVKIHFPEPHVATEAELQEMKNRNSYLSWSHPIFIDECYGAPWHVEHEPFNPSTSGDVVLSAEDEAPLGVVQSVDLNEGTAWVTLTDLSIGDYDGFADLTDSSAGDYIATIRDAFGGIWNGTMTIPKSKIDEKYPHTCHRCKKELRFKELTNAHSNVDLEIEFFDNVLKRYGLHGDMIEGSKLEKYFISKGRSEYKKYMKQLWKSSVVEFYCCSCYEKELHPEGMLHGGDYNGFTCRINPHDMNRWL